MVTFFLVAVVRIVIAGLRIVTPRTLLPPRRYLYSYTHLLYTYMHIHILQEKSQKEKSNNYRFSNFSQRLRIKKRCCYLVLRLIISYELLHKISILTYVQSPSAILSTTFFHAWNGYWPYGKLKFCHGYFTIPARLESFVCSNWLLT